MKSIRSFLSFLASLCIRVIAAILLGVILLTLLIRFLAVKKEEKQNIL